MAQTCEMHGFSCNTIIRRLPLKESVGTGLLKGVRKTRRYPLLKGARIICKEIFTLRKRKVTGLLSLWVDKTFSCISYCKENQPVICIDTGFALRHKPCRCTGITAERSGFGVMKNLCRVGLMAWLTSIKKTLFGNRAAPELQESPDELRTMFKARYREFKALLDANNKALEIMATMEQVLREGQSFGMKFVRANCTAISVNVYKIIHGMNNISGDRYLALYDVFDKIRGKINQILEPQMGTAKGVWIFPLEAVDKEMADEVGGKMANLGEIRNRVGLSVPEGFVITASGYRHFLEYNALQDEIDRRLQLLDLGQLEMLHRASADIQQLIIRSPLPGELGAQIHSAYRELEERTKKGVHVSLRSSAIGEDTGKASFAGQYASRLNVSPEFLGHTYKEILASKYSPQAISYQMNMGFRDEDVPMCVGVMAMVDAISSGVMYSRDPGNVRNNVVVINAVWGLAKSVVDGTVSPDLFVVSKDPPGKILKAKIGAKDSKFVCFPEEGVCRMVLAGEERNEPAMTKDQMLSTASLGVRLEDYYGSPQDVEWSIGDDGIVKILQSRPLRQMEGKTQSVSQTSDMAGGAPILLDSGITACPGVGWGPAFLVNHMLDALQFPAGAVLVTQHALPQWAALLDRAAAVITDHGGITGHLATVSREYEVPALFDTTEGTKRIKNGMIVTVDADAMKVYEGKVTSLLGQTSPAKRKLMEGSPVHRILDSVLKYVSPLNLTDPEGHAFRPQGCRTYHDITRFCHEKAVKEMFSFAKDHHFTERGSKQLVCDIPMQWWVIDLEDGFKKSVEGDEVHLENIASIPMLALWEGITAIPWKGPPPVDTKGLLSVMFQSTMDPSLNLTRKSRYAEKNYFIISKHFCNLTSRWGYHFSTIEAFLGINPGENYVGFKFKGGGADMTRRRLRLGFIEHILKKFDFGVEIIEDCMTARLEGYDQDFLIERLKVLGYMSMHTRQLDMVMANRDTVDYYVAEHLRDIRSFVKVETA